MFIDLISQLTNSMRRSLNIMAKGCDAIDIAVSKQREDAPEVQNRSQLKQTMHVNMHRH